MKKKSALATVLLSGLLSFSCANQGLGDELATNENIVTEENNLEEAKSLEEQIIENDEVSVQEINKDAKIDPISTCYYVGSITTTSAANFRVSPDLNSNVLLIVPNNYCTNIYKKVNDFYELEINGVKGYLHESVVKEKTTPQFPFICERICYLKDDTVITLIDGTTVILPKYESCEVYDEKEDGRLLVKTNEYIGYIYKENTVELDDKFVIVDISDQILKLYDDNEVVLTSPVVTGKKSSPSTEGIFEIYDISTNRYLVGPGYKSYIDVMMKYHNGEGLHDAEYHQDENGFSHGWRSYEEFGGETYINHGSHGCVNMPHDAAMQTYEYVELGTKVLVKK